MIDFRECELYGVKRKRDLYFILRATKEEVVLVLNRYKVCINEENRLLEKPNFQLKKLQKRLLSSLYQIGFPPYVFSGVKKKSAYGNAIQHINSNNMLKIDISKFFPNTHRDKVYNFFLKRLKMSPDVAKICTDITTINYKEKHVYIEEAVMEYLKINHIKIKNHLPSGAPTSQILSYLVNIDMFDEIDEYCNTHKLLYSIYVDDLTLSTNRNISFKEEKQLKAIVNKYGHSLNKKKTIRYKQNEYKKVTGFVISPNHYLVVSNKTRKRIKDMLSQVEDVTIIDEYTKNSLMGLVTFAQLSKIDAYDRLKKQLKTDSKECDSSIKKE